MFLVIDVNRESIDFGMQAKCSSCPVALAVNKVLPSGWWSLVGICHVEIWREGFSDCYITTFRMPRWVQDRVRDYDREGHMTPFKFYAEVGDWTFGGNGSTSGDA